MGKVTGSQVVTTSLGNGLTPITQIVGITRPPTRGHAPSSGDRVNVVAYSVQVNEPEHAARAAGLVQSCQVSPLVESGGSQINGR